MMRYLTAGESHGRELTAIIEGIPAGLCLLAEDINIDLARRQKGYGRGGRMQIEKDEVQIVAGVRHGKTLASPITFIVKNRDWQHWEEVMSVSPIDEVDKEIKRQVTNPRPGHADLNGAIKYGHRDIRNVLERSSARDTTMRVVVGAVAKQILKDLGISIASHVVRIGQVEAESVYENLEQLRQVTEESSVRCFDGIAGIQMMQAIDEAKVNGDSLGGVVEVIVEGVPIGIGSYVHYDRKLDAKIAAAIVGINAFKGVEFGIGFESAGRFGSEVHDEIIWNKETGFSRKTNRAGGFEGGMTTGMPIIVRGVMKPIPTLYKPLMSVDIDSKEPHVASVERSDVCAVPAASVVAEAVVAWEIATAIVNQFGTDRMDVLIENVERMRKEAKEF